MYSDGSRVTSQPLAVMPFSISTISCFFRFMNLIHRSSSCNAAF